MKQRLSEAMHESKRKTYQEHIIKELQLWKAYRADGKCLVFQTNEKRLRPF